MAFFKTNSELINKCVKCGSLSVELTEETVYCHDCAENHVTAKDISIKDKENQ